MIRVDFERCTGCGICADFCPQKAIGMIDGRAAIDDRLCGQCEACINACPQGALSSVPSVPAFSTRSALLPATVPQRGVPAARLASVTWRKRVLPILGAAISLAAREIIPRVVDALVSAPAPGRYSLGTSQGMVRGVAEGGQRLRRRRHGRSPRSG